MCILGEFFLLRDLYQELARDLVVVVHEFR